jgi:hypothetical protein
MGCSTAFSYAVRYPQYVAGLLLHWPVGGTSFYDFARDRWMANGIRYARELAWTALSHLRGRLAP